MQSSDGAKLGWPPPLSSFLLPSVCVCRTAWVQKIKAASELFIETEKKKREKAYLGVRIFFFHHL